MPLPVEDRLQQSGGGADFSHVGIERQCLLKRPLGVVNGRIRGKSPARAEHCISVRYAGVGHSAPGSTAITSRNSGFPFLGLPRFSCFSEIAP